MHVLPPFLQAPEGKDSVDSEYILYNRSVAQSGSFTNTREVFKRFDLDPGRYVIVVCTFKPNEEGDYLLRIFSEKMSKPRKEGMEGKSDSQLKEDGVRALFRRLAGADNEIDCDELQDIMTFSLKKGVCVCAYIMLVHFLALVELGMYAMIILYTRLAPHTHTHLHTQSE